MIRSHLLAIPGGGFYLGPAPSAAPSSPMIYFIGGEGGNVAVQWVVGDPDSGTQVAFASGGEPTASTEKVLVGPGVSSYETEQSANAVGWYVRHARNGQFSAWVGPADV